MVGQLEGVERVSQPRVLVDALAVVEEVVVDLEGHGHGPAMDQLELHERFVAAPVEAAHVAVLGGVVAEAALLRSAGRVGARVGEAPLLHQPEVLGVLTCHEVREAAFTACGESARGQRRLADRAARGAAPFSCFLPHSFFLKLYLLCGCDGSGASGGSPSCGEPASHRSGRSGCGLP